MARPGPICQVGTAFLEPEDKACAGPLWEAPRYFLKTGASLYKCEKHARLSVRINPWGPSYRPVRTEVR